MKHENLAEEIARLTLEEQAAVGEFVQFLRRKSPPACTSPFLAAIDEFIRLHPDLLRRLAQ